MRWPSLDTNHLRGVPQLVRAPRPGRRRARAIVVVARTSRSPLSTATRANGSIDALARPRPGDRLAGHAAPMPPRDDRAALAAAISAAPAPGGAHGGVGEVRGTAKKPHPEPTSARTPMPESALLRDRLDVAVARRHRLVAPVHHPRVGVAGAGVERGWPRPAPRHRTRSRAATLRQGGAPSWTRRVARHAPADTHRSPFPRHPPRRSRRAAAVEGLAPGPRASTPRSTERFPRSDGLPTTSPSRATAARTVPTVSVGISMCTRTIGSQTTVRARSSAQHQHQRRELAEVGRRRARRGTHGLRLARRRRSSRIRSSSRRSRSPASRRDPLAASGRRTASWPRRTGPSSCR